MKTKKEVKKVRFNGNKNSQRNVIYKIMAEVTGESIEYLKKAREVQLIRPSEVVEIIKSYSTREIKEEHNGNNF